MSYAGKGIIAVFGTRAPGGAVSQAVASLVNFVSRLGYTIRTGGAEGVDEAAMFATEGRLEVMLPWATYNEALMGKVAAAKKDLAITVYNPLFHQDWTKSVTDLHPYSKGLTRGPFALHARNYGIVAGSILGVAFPNYINNPNGGGTSQGIRIAKALGVPLIESPIGGEWTFESLLMRTLQALGESGVLAEWKEWNAKHLPF